MNIVSGEYLCADERFRALATDSRLILGDTKSWDENIDDCDQKNADGDEIVDPIGFADVVLVLNIVPAI